MSSKPSHDRQLGHDPFRNVTAVVLAAGEATRFGAPKQRVLLPYVLDHLAATPVHDVVVVAGAYPLELEGVRVVTAPDWEAGPGTSLRAGLRALQQETEAVVVVLADGPTLSPDAVRRVVLAWRFGAGNIVAASYGGSRSHPLVIGRSSWASIPDEGLRNVPVTLVGCDDLGAPGDIDTQADLRDLGLVWEE